MTNPEAEGYDIISDVHGCATQLEALLVELGYQEADGTAEYRHPRRQAIFVGDLIDRGDGSARHPGSDRPSKVSARGKG